jgi:hypothetical protein
MLQKPSPNHHQTATEPSRRAHAAPHKNPTKTLQTPNKTHPQTCGGQRRRRVRPTNRPFKIRLSAPAQNKKSHESHGEKNQTARLNDSNTRFRTDIHPKYAGIRQENRPKPRRIASFESTWLPLPAALCEPRGVVAIFLQAGSITTTRAARLQSPHAGPWTHPPKVAGKTACDPFSVHPLFHPRLLTPFSSFMDIAVANGGNYDTGDTFPSYFSHTRGGVCTGINVAFEDGHVKWFKMDVKWTNQYEGMGGGPPYNICNAWHGDVWVSGPGMVKGLRY